MATLHTPRLILRNWRDADADSSARVNADPRIMEFLPACLSQAQSNPLLQKIRDHIEARGLGLFAVELTGQHGLVGFIGLSVPSFEANFTPGVETGPPVVRRPPSVSGSNTTIGISPPEDADGAPAPRLLQMYRARRDQDVGP
jgi:hypothetical protein